MIEPEHEVNVLPCRERRGKIVLQYLMVLEYRNMTHTLMITIKCKKFSQMMF